MTPCMQKPAPLQKQQGGDVYKRQEQGLPIDNVKTLAHDIERIPTLLDKADRVERIYITFCNPWNKKANHKMCIRDRRHSA